MGFFDSMKANQLGMRAYRIHVSAMQMRKAGKYDQSEEKLAQAIKMYDEAYAMGFRKSNVLQGYALLLMRRGEFEKAREVMLECSKDKGMSPENRLTLRVDYSICQWKMGKLDKAIETIRNAAQSKKNGTIYTTLGMFLVEQARRTGEFEEALRFNEEALEYDDEDAGVLDNVGQLYLLMADKAKADGDEASAEAHWKKALDAFQKARSEKPDQISSNYFLAKMLHADGEDEKARKVLDDTLKIPFSSLLQVTLEQVEALRREVG